MTDVPPVDGLVLANEDLRLIAHERTGEVIKLRTKIERLAEIVSRIHGYYNDLQIHHEKFCKPSCGTAYGVLPDPAEFSAPTPTPETGPPLSDALPGCMFRFCPNLDKCEADGCPTPWPTKVEKIGHD
jgi:hypothetical protein